MIEAVIVDDEIKALQSLSWELSNFCEEIIERHFGLAAVFHSPFKDFRRGVGDRIGHL